MALSFRPIHLIWLLILLIILETAVLYLKHPDTFEHVIPAHLHNYYSGRYPHNHSHSKGGKHSHSSGHDLHFHGERPTFGMHVARREAGAPRVAIVTLQKLSSQRHGGIPSNVKKYAQHWKYDLIDASKSVSTAAKALRSGGGDPSFLRGERPLETTCNVVQLDLCTICNFNCSSFLFGYYFFFSVVISLCYYPFLNSVRLGLLARCRLCVSQF